MAGEPFNTIPDRMQRLFPTEMCPEGTKPNARRKKVHSRDIWFWIPLLCKQNPIFKLFWKLENHLYATVPVSVVVGGGGGGVSQYL